MEKHIFLSDFQIPDQDDELIDLVYKFILDYKPDHIHLVGDILNLTKVSKYLQDVYDKVSFWDEIQEGRRVLNQLVKVGRKANPKVKITFFEGNHEERLLKYLASKAPELADLQDDGDYMLSLRYILKLKDLGIKWVGYKQDYDEHKLIIEHGDRVRNQSAYTAKAMLDSRGEMGISGHTHRLGMHMKTLARRSIWWIENGCLNKLHHHSPYVKYPDWQQGFTIASYIDGDWFPQLIPIVNKKFFVNGKLYRA